MSSAIGWAISVGKNLKQQREEASMDPLQETIMDPLQEASTDSLQVASMDYVL